MIALQKLNDWFILIYSDYKQHIIPWLGFKNITLQSQCPSFMYVELIKEIIYIFANYVFFREEHLMWGLLC